MEKDGGAEVFQEIYGWDQDQTEDLLGLMDPRPPESIITVGNDATHTYSFDDAKRAVGDDEESLRRAIDIFTVQYGTRGHMGTVSARLQGSLGRSNTKLGELASWIKKWKLGRTQGQSTQVQGRARPWRSKKGNAKSLAMDAGWSARE